MLTTLAESTRATCGGKAATLGVLLREGLPVPDGFVVPHFGALDGEVAAALARMGDPPVAVRSSAAGEDGAGASAAGQYESVLAVQGADAVAAAIRVCRDSASSARVAGYWHRSGGDTTPEMAVLVQRLIDAEVSGVMFTPARPGDPVRVEASWGLGLAVVGGTVTPDAFELAADGTIERRIARKPTRLDRGSGGVVARDVPLERQTSSTLDDGEVTRLAALGACAADLLGGPQDVEWAIADGVIWLLQSRPVTAPLPPTPSGVPPAASLTGTPGAHGVVTGTARVVRGPDDFGRVRPGEILICPYTDPAWTPLFTVAAAIVTETGGALSHAAIVAREYRIPAVVGVPGAITRVPDGARVTLDGTKGTLTLH
ncbi:PEP/pyruvate-binding domain-containing protein [Actinorhabdospora filicis]|nr:PEP/pyruvate-binding domain-containing protein [Actinorhabdospora filicis]